MQRHGGPWGSQMWSGQEWMSSVWKGCCSWKLAYAGAIPWQPAAQLHLPRFFLLYLPLPHLYLWRKVCIFSSEYCLEYGLAQSQDHLPWGVPLTGPPVKLVPGIRSPRKALWKGQMETKVGERGGRAGKAGRVTKDSEDPEKSHQGDYSFP